MIWCPTRMANLLSSSLQIIKILLPLCDLLTSCAIKREEAAYFLSPMCLNILHLMADEGIFVAAFLRKLDTNEAIIIEVFSQSERMAKCWNEE